MRTPRIVEAMNYIDDDLVSWAVDYKPTPRKKITHFWKQIVAVAACLCVIAMTSIFTQQNDVIPPIDDTPPINNGDVIDNTPTITDPIMENIVWNDVSSIPEIMLPFLGEENRTAMSSKEMFEYYGIDIATQLTATGLFNEITGSYPHGIYTFSDSVFDMNHFVFVSEDGMQEIEFYIGKTTDCERYVSNLNVNEYEQSKVNGSDMYICQYKDAHETCLFSMLDVNGCSVIVLSNNIDEQTFVSTLKSLINN